MAKSAESSGRRMLAPLTVYGIGMAYVEAMVVVYLRMLIPMNVWDQRITTDTQSIVRLLQEYHVYWTEQTREIATIVMLVAIALIAGATIKEKLASFLYTFAVWDIFYYIFLYALIKWPKNLGVWDVLFLIPSPWVAPVYVPVLISCVMIVLSMILLGQSSARKTPSKSKKH